MPNLRKAGYIAQYAWTHPANEGRRINAVARSASYQFRARVLGKRTLARLGANSLVWADPRRRISSYIVYASIPDYPEMLTWKKSLHAGDLFLDVGSNIGSYAIFAAELGANVIALEPAEDTFKLLEENVALNNYSIQTIRAAAGALEGTARFTTGRDCINHFDPNGGAEVPMVTLDSIIGSRTVGGLKIDVEGFEIEVLRGCERALTEQRIRLMQLEWNILSQQAVGTDRQPVADLLAKYGYTLYRPSSGGALLPTHDTAFGADIFALPT